MHQHKVIFEVSVDGLEQWEGIVTNVENLQKTLAGEGTQIALVAHGKGIGLILKKNEAMRNSLQSAFASGVCFAACENTMRRMHLQKQDLMQFAVTVDSGVAEIVRKQESGWSYIKSGS